MNHTLIFTSLLAAAALVAGCTRSADKPATAETTAQQLDKAQAAAKEATQEMQDYAFAQKAEFVAGMKAQLVELNRSLDELSARIETSSETVKAEARPKLAALRAQSAQLTRQVEAVQDATATTWTGVKTDAQKAYAALQDGFAQARQWVSDKIAP